MSDSQIYVSGAQCCATCRYANKISENGKFQTIFCDTHGKDVSGKYYCNCYLRAYNKPEWSKYIQTH